ncbi:HAD-IA family hydrolase [Compostimonas suwonensis]|uniref:HAD superfamily hydrolase (TIGR01509 family) n=1 Tax=Compostimonas suwonensis TaxID=1048394 RepID=A0A2M9C378_9MICO|nr:HAD-IA family hydrolase [Compostimonas suwonensis]PJJ65003.1 HAD superfamily hydrolase (TIGR01509 family) [Compostimonas suwonensis]
MPALIFDCDGVLADTERYGHLPAFNQVFEEFGLPVRWSEDDYAVKVLISGGKERLASLLTPEFVAEAGLPVDEAGQREAVAAWHKRKTQIYTELVATGALPARPGIRRIVEEAAAAGFDLAVASTSAEPSVRAVLEHAVGPELAARFHVFAGDIVPAKKPSPDIYLLALREIGVPASEAIVVEDSANGLRAAVAAGIRTIVTVSSYTENEDFTGAQLVVSSLGEPATAPGGPVPAAVLAAASGIVPDGFVDVGVLRAVLAAPPPPASGPTTTASAAPAPDQEDV